MAEHRPRRTMRELLKELGLEQGRGIEDFGRLAHEVQRVRGASGVSRATGLLVIAQLDDDLNEILGLAGFDRTKFGMELGVTTMPDRTASPEGYPGDIELRSRFENAIREFARMNPNTQEIGYGELARAIVESLADWTEDRGLAGHLARVGVDADGMPRLARSLALARQVLEGEGTTVDLAVWRMEAHVEQSVHVAAALAGHGVITARTALKAVISVGQTSLSESFDAFSDIAGRPLVVQADPSRSHPVDFDGVKVSPAFAESLKAAEPYLADPPGDIWGRDFITLALTASDDASLSEFAADIGVDLNDLRDRWRDYVVSDGKRRSSERWNEWMSLAGASVTEHETTFLLTWNPDRFPFSRFEAQARQVREKGEAVMGWSTGQRRKGVNPGDRVFLMRQGVEPRGLVGAGRIEESPVEEPHWDPDQASQGKTYPQAQVRWSVLRKTPVISLEDLLEKFGEENLWQSQAGGRVIDPKLAEPLSASWREALELEASALPVAWVDTDAVPVIGAPNGFRPSEHDSLDAGEQARTFATLLISDNVKPPFALGLLGDWGVGKTFFMRLMQENVYDVAGKDAPRRVPGAVSRAAQIEFNAWHYVDSDLWASLASHIFDNLSRELAGTEHDADRIRRELRRRIHSSVREKAEARANIESAVLRRQKAALDLEARQEARKDLSARLTSSRLERLWRAVLAVRPVESDPNTKDWPDLSEARDQAQAVARRLGIAESIDGVKEAERVYRQLKDVQRGGKELTRSLAAEFVGGRAWLSSVAVIALVALVVAWPWILDAAEGLIGQEGQGLTSFLEPFLRLGTVVGAGLVWASKRLTSVASALGYLEAIKEEMLHPRVQPDDPSQEEKHLRIQIEGLDTAIAKGRHRIEQADHQIAEAEAEIQRINAGGLVYDFLEGKVRDSRYLDRLGLISVIRNDFDRLGELLEDWRKHGEDSANNDARPIERIILYIDDLDRCPPKRVVEVLQAVHLLLAFDLFAVVVAVDARWLERSLNEDYNSWGVTHDGAGSENSVHRFSAKNYLEKIFQIPFSLPAMDAEAYRSLMTGMIVGGQAPAEPTALPPEPQVVEGPLTPRPGGHTPPLSMSPDEGQEDGVSSSGEHKQSSASKTSEPDDEPKQSDEDQRREQELEAAGRRIEATMLSAPEEEFILALYTFIRTPRLAKRLLNIYRLLRVRAASQAEPFSAFIDRDTGGFRAVLVALALGVGRPEFGSELLERIHLANGEGSFRQWLAKEAANAEEERSRLEATRIENNRAAGLSDPPSVPERTLASRKEALEQLDNDLASLIDVLEEAGAPPFDDRLESYLAWARVVGRYSFSWQGGR